jgi:hypothetical protein
MAIESRFSREFYSRMTVRTRILRLFEQEDINFLLTNRIPRRLATQFIGWFSRIEQPLVRDLSIAAVAAVLRPRSGRGEKDAIPQPARLLHPRAQGRRAADRPPRTSWSARATPSSAPAARSPEPNSIKPKAFPTRCKTCCAIDPASKAATATAAMSRCG